MRLAPRLLSRLSVRGLESVQGFARRDHVAVVNKGLPLTTNFRPACETTIDAGPAHVTVDAKRASAYGSRAI
jgi:hypothetical protein